MQQYGIYQQNLSNGEYCNYSARASWRQLYHLDVLMVHQYSDVPFCFICAEEGEFVTVWYSEDISSIVSGFSNLLDYS